MQEACGNAYMRRPVVQMGEAWPASGGKAYGKPDIAYRDPRKNATSPPTQRELFGALFGSFAANRTQCIIEKAVVFVAVSYFKHIFIIIHSYIPLYTII